MSELMQYIWPITVLVIFGGMLALCWKALNIAHDLAKIVLQSGLTPQVSLPKIPIVPRPAAPIPAPVPIPASPTPEVPDEVIDQGLVNFIKKQEGYSAKAYWDYKQ